MQQYINVIIHVFPTPTANEVVVGEGWGGGGLNCFHHGCLFCLSVCLSFHGKVDSVQYLYCLFTYNNDTSQLTHVLTISWGGPLLILFYPPPPPPANQVGGGYIGITLFVCLSIRLSVQSKLNLDHNFLTKGDRVLIIGQKWK